MKIVFTKQLVLLIATILLVVQSLTACDFCGCYMGITPYDNQSNITMLYRYKSYNGYSNTHQHSAVFPSFKSQHTTTTNAAANASSINQYGLRHGTFTPNDTSKSFSQKDYELYTSIDLRAKYFLHKRIELNAIVPLQMNAAQVDKKNQRIKSVGDISIYAGFHLIQRILTDKIQQRLIVGLGIKLPTGFNNSKDENNNRINYMMQAGTGTTDYFINLNYIVAYKKVGINFNTTYKYNGENAYHERLENSTTNYLSVFMKLREEKKVKVFPSIQAYYEYCKGMYVHNQWQAATTMNIATAGLGVDLYYKNFGFNAAFQLPLYEEKFEGNLKLAARAIVGISYNINQSNYLIKKRNS